MTLDRANIQGFVVRGYRLPVAAYLFLRVDDPVKASRWISYAADEVITAAPWSEKPAAGINVAFTYAGLKALLVPDYSLAGFPTEFREGMAARAALLGDEGEGHPSNWEEPFRAPDDLHLMVMISAKDDEKLESRKARVCERIESFGGLTLIGSQIGKALESGREHFGFADGVGQPSIEGSGVKPLPGQGAVEGKGWRPIRAGEFILGYLDEEGVLPVAPTPDQLTANGSFLVYRKLHQDVARFRQQLEEAAKHYPGSEGQLAAKMVGRWADGTPLALSPDAPDPELARDRMRNNDFSYADDGEGGKCPIGAHIRRANPREGLPFQGKLVNRHRMIRRGIAYGSELSPGAKDDDGQERGLIFTSLQASIERQFEFVQSQWMQSGNAFGIGDDQDALTGSQSCDQPKMVVPGSPPFLMDGLARLVTCRGGEYFFTPGVNGLHFISAADGKE